MFCQCVLNDRDKLGYFLKEKRLTGLHRDQNFRQAALESYLAEALSNMPEFGSERTMKFESTYEHNTSRNEIASRWRYDFTVW